MKSGYQTRLPFLLALIWFICLPTTAISSSLSLVPSTTNIDVLDTVMLDIVISDRDGALVGAYDVDVSYDATLISFDSYGLGSSLGAPTFSIDNSLGDSGTGVNVSELSLLSSSELGAEQITDSLILASLTFQGLDNGSAVFDISRQLFSDDLGNVLPITTLNSATVRIGAAPIPEPSTFLLLSGGMATLAFYARRKKKG